MILEGAADPLTSGLLLISTSRSLHTLTPPSRRLCHRFLDPKSEFTPLLRCALMHGMV